MRRLFHQTKLYDYTSKAEAEKHITQIKCIRIQTIIYTGLSIKEAIYTF